MRLFAISTLALIMTASLATAQVEMTVKSPPSPGGPITIPDSKITIPASTVFRDNDCVVTWDGSMCLAMNTQGNLIGNSTTLEDCQNEAASLCNQIKVDHAGKPVSADPNADDW